MDKRIAIIKDNKVSNIILAGDDFISSISDEYIILSDRQMVSPGDDYRDGSFSRPEPVRRERTKSAEEQLKLLFEDIKNGLDISSGSWYTDRINS